MRATSEKYLLLLYCYKIYTLSWVLIFSIKYQNSKAAKKRGGLLHWYNVWITEPSNHKVEEQLVEILLVESSCRSTPCILRWHTVFVAPKSLSSSFWFFLFERNCLEVIAVQWSGCVVDVFDTSQCSTYLRLVSTNYKQCVWSVTSYRSSGNESTGSIVLTSEGGFESSSVERRGCAAAEEGEGRWNGTTPKSKDSVVGAITLFQALRYWKILFSPSDFEPTSVRNCQFLTQPVRNCQHADPYQVLGLERSEQQWMSPRVNPGGIANQLPPGWKGTSVSEPAVKEGNTVCLKTSWR